MGGSVKTLAPIAAIAGIAALGVATGGFGLFAAAPAAAAAGGAGAAAGAGAGAAAGTAASTSLLGSFGTFLSANAGPLAVGASVLSGGANILGASQQAGAIEAQLQAEARQDAVRVAEEERNVQVRLARTFAAQNAYFGALGIDPGSGSPGTLSLAAQRDSERELASLRFNASSREILRLRRRADAGSLVPNAAIGAVGGIGGTALALA